MTYVLRVISGQDEGKSVEIEEGRDCLIGRSAAAQLRVRDDSVSWEHATVRLTDGKLFIENLSALGTLVRGKKVDRPERLNPADEIELSPLCKIIVELTTHARQHRTHLVPLILTLIFFVGALIVALFLVLPKPVEAQRPVSAAQWRQGFLRIESRMAQWGAERRVPDEFVMLFRDAWRTEQVGDLAGAVVKWERLRSAMLSTPIPDAVNGSPTFAEHASKTHKALGVITGWDTAASSSDPEWNTDSAYADAAYWFVRRRAESTRRQLAEQQAAAQPKK